MDAEREKLIDHVLSGDKENCPKCEEELFLSPPGNYDERHPGVYCKKCDFSILIEFEKL